MSPCMEIKESHPELSEYKYKWQYIDLFKSVWILLCCLNFNITSFNVYLCLFGERVLECTKSWVCWNVATVHLPSDHSPLSFPLRSWSSRTWRPSSTVSTPSLLPRWPLWTLGSWTARVWQGDTCATAKMSPESATSNSIIFLRNQSFLHNVATLCGFIMSL